jgi:hypothetical protein
MDFDILLEAMFTLDSLLIVESGDDIVVSRIAEALKSQLVRVKHIFFENGLNVAGAKALDSALRVNTSVDELHFDGFEDGCMAALWRGVLTNANIKILAFESLGVDDACLLARALRSNTSLEILSLYRNESIGDEGVIALADSLLNQSRYFSCNAALVAMAQGHLEGCWQ